MMPKIDVLYDVYSLWVTVLSDFEGADVIGPLGGVCGTVHNGRCQFQMKHKPEHLWLVKGHDSYKVTL